MTTTPNPRGQIAAWCIYDLSNTIYSAIFLTFFFPLFIKNYVGGTEGHIGTVFTISTLLSAIMVPIVGAFSDQVGRRMPFLIVCTVGCCAATALVGFSGLWLSLVLAIVSNFFYSISLAVYDALLPKLVGPERHGSVSGYGVAVGYLGTPIALVAVIILMAIMGWDREESVRATFWLTALLFFGIALYPFAMIREPKIASGRHLRSEVIIAFRVLWATIRSLPKQPGYLLFLSSAFLFNNAIMSVVYFLYLFGEQELGLTPQTFVGVYAGMAFAAAFGGVLSGYMTDRFGPRAVLFLSALTWITVLLVFLNVKTMLAFWLGGMVGGIALAAFNTAVRPLLIQFADPNKMGEYFGFLALFNKASGAFGPFVFGWLVTLFNYNVGLICLIVFFVIGMVCLYFTPDLRARSFFSIFKGGS